ncbi:hypothetical protein P170DRAFT_508944 [Aspergillus steynii IBT 23096]|uniref:Uncharacterized protein n=1 Tax=Aspergillus steynii IBT 23096 TaxID=1392250 RepID=A0A2I2GD99_9EURO|nr:uncharacterized protein P170DRAFT_508944 [Aspergillus steynii IBT 23096]PLB50840.1 hypothetical protein P170DRAFT_508944 [Aspergillus steynii IBT 23096]
MLYISFIIPIIFLLSPVKAWNLDRRCVELGYESVVKNGMTGALDLAAAAVDTLDALSSHTNNAAQLDLFQYIFGFAVKTTNGHREVIPEEVNYIKGIYNNVLKFAVLTGDERSNDVVIYCDYSRYIEGMDCNGVENSSVACDKDTSRKVDMDFSYKSCKSKSGYIPLMALTGSNGLSNFGQVDICGWYLEFRSKSKIKYWWHLGAKMLLAWPIHAGYNALYQRTRMDGYALLDHTLIHELTHAISVRPTDDISGWKRCVEFEKKRELGRFNADNYAYFALDQDIHNFRSENDQPNRQQAASTA